MMAKSEEIQSRSYIYNVKLISAEPDIYTLFLNVISHNVDDPKNRKIWIFNTWNDKTKDINYYPLIVISSPNIPSNKLTFNKKRSRGSIEIIVLSTSKKELQTLSSQVNYAILNSRSIFKKFNITNIDLVDSDDDFERTNKTAGRHSKRLYYEFDYTFTIQW